MSNEAKSFDVLFVSGKGIGNVLQTLYALEYVLSGGGDAALYVTEVPASLVAYLQSCYPGRILRSLAGVSCKALVQSWLVPNPPSVPFEDYYYVRADDTSSRFQSETEIQISLAKALCPGGQASHTLRMLREDKPSGFDDIGEKIILYPGCKAAYPSKRWPHFEALQQALGKERTLLQVGPGDFDFSKSYYYPRWTTRVFPKRVTNKKVFWEGMRKAGLLQTHAGEIPGTVIPEPASRNWSQLVYLLRRALCYIGNDGGISHLAGASGASGLVLFGPTSADKSRPFNPKLVPVRLDLPCSPCQLGHSRIAFEPDMIACPRQLECMYDLTVGKVCAELEKHGFLSLQARAVS